MSCVGKVYAQAVAATGAVPPLVACLSSSLDHVQEWAAAALSVIVEDSGQRADAAFAAGAIGSLVACLRSQSAVVQDRVAEALASLTATSSRCAEATAGSGAIAL